MKFLRPTIVIATLLTLLVAVPAAASTPAWRAAKRAALPYGALGIPDGFIPTLSCVKQGDCEAGAAYINDLSQDEGLILNEENGVWTAPTTIEAPVGAAANPGVTLYALSCVGVGDCVAAGSYVDGAGNAEALVANEVAGHWARAREVALPANATNDSQVAEVRGVECLVRNDCSAVGTYMDNNPVASRNQGFTLSEVGGVWHRAVEITISAKSNFNPFVSMYQLDCSSAGNCVGVGSFIDANDVTQALLVDQVHGAWRAGAELALPLSASAYAGGALSEVTCVRRASCSVFGTFYASGGAEEGLVATETSGAWPRASELTMPANAGTNPHVFLYGFDGIACASSGNCAVGGQYQDAAGDYEGFLENETDGTWHSAVELSLPAGGVYAGKNGGVVAVACPKAGNCRASGAYVAGGGNYQAVVVSEVNGAWQTGVKIALPAGATTVGVDGGIYSLVCSTTSSCTGTGSYLATATTYEGFTLST